jgi:branched-subunit amino acid ABC-type transport system permease component
MQILQSILNGIINGGVLALAALGLTLAFGIARFANVAHGDMLTLGAYVTLSLNQGLGLNLGISLAGGIVAAVVVGLTIYQGVYRPLARESSVTLLLASIGVGLFLRFLIVFIWGSELQNYRLPAERAMTFLGGLRITRVELLVITAAAVLMLAVHLFLTRTRIGKEMRAVSDLPDLARVVGIGPHRVTAVMWAISAGLAAVAGVLFGMKNIITPYMGWDLLLSGFAAAILGGIGNVYGAMLGGLLVGVSEELAVLVMPPTYKAGVAFIIMTLVLLVRPTGLMGGQSR